MSDAVTYEQIVKLHEKREDLSPSEIIKELETIRTQNGYLPWYPGKLMIYQIYKTLAKSDELTETNVRKMARMLFWEEYPAQQIHGMVLLALERYPHHEFRAILTQFISKTKDEMLEVGAGSASFADLSAHKKWAERILTKC